MPWGIIVDPFHPDRAPWAAPAWSFLRIFPLLGCALVSSVAGLLACHGALALVFFGLEWMISRPEAARIHLLASRHGLIATVIMVTNGLTVAAGLGAARRWDACRWRPALVATAGMILGVAASLGVLTLL